MVTRWIGDDADDTPGGVLAGESLGVSSTPADDETADAERARSEKLICSYTRLQQKSAVKEQICWLLVSS